MQNELNKKIARATKWSTITEFATKLSSPIVNIVLARLLAPEEFGVVATIMMVITFAEVFTDAGFQKYLIQHEYKDKKELDQSTNIAFWTNFFFSALICCGIFIWRDALAASVGNPGLGDSLSIASILIVIAAFSSIQMARYRRALDFKTLFYSRVIGAAAPFVVTIPLAFVLRNYWALLIGTMTAQATAAIFLTIKSEWKPSFYYNWGQLREMFAFSMWTLFEALTIWLVIHVAIFIVGNHLSDYYLGLFRTSSATVVAYMSLITASVTPVLFVALSRNQNNEKEFKKIFYLFLRVTAIFVLPLGFGIYMFSDLATYLLLGPQWMEASEFIGWLGAVIPFSILFSNFASEVYRSKGQPKISLFVHLFHLLFLIPAIMISVRYGFRVLCATRAALLLHLCVTALLVMRFYYKFKLLEILERLRPMIFSALTMCGVGYACLLASRYWLGGTLADAIDASDWHRIALHLVCQVGAVGICVATYGGVLFGCFADVRNEALNTSYGQKIARKAQSIKAKLRA